MNLAAGGEGRHFDRRGSASGRRGKGRNPLPPPRQAESGSNNHRYIPPARRPVVSGRRARRLAHSRVFDNLSDTSSRDVWVWPRPHRKAPVMPLTRCGPKVLFPVQSRLIGVRIVVGASRQVRVATAASSQGPPRWAGLARVSARDGAHRDSARRFGGANSGPIHAGPDVRANPHGTVRAPERFVDQLQLAGRHGGP